MYMNTKYFFLSVCLLAVFAFGYFVMATVGDERNKSFVIVVPSYNNKEWYKRNLDSIFSQKYENFRVIYTDDASPDGTGNLVRDYIQEKGEEDRVLFIQNKERRGSLANLYNMIGQCDKYEIVVDCDGDDWLKDDQVLAYLNEVYSDPDVWMTYGQFISYPTNTLGFASQVPEKVIEKNEFRSFRGSVTHLRTFYAGLFHKIKREDLLYEGNFFQVAGDMAFLLPICEMSGRHSKFISQVLYVYNLANPISDDRIQREMQVKLDNLIRQKEKYQPINHF